MSSNGIIWAPLLNLLIFYVLMKSSISLIFPLQPWQVGYSQPLLSSTYCAENSEVPIAPSLHPVPFGSWINYYSDISYILILSCCTLTIYNFQHVVAMPPYKYTYVPNLLNIYRSTFKPIDTGKPHRDLSEVPHVHFVLMSRPLILRKRSELKAKHTASHVNDVCAFRMRHMTLNIQPEHRRTVALKQ